MFDAATFLPIVAALVGIVSLFTPTDSDTGSRARRLRLVAVGALFVLQLVICVLTIRSDQEKDAKAAGDAARLNSQIDTLQTKLSSVQEATSGVSTQLAAFMRSVGFSSENVQTLTSGPLTPAQGRVLAQAFSANVARDNLLASSPRTSRTQTTVELFPKGVDRAVVNRALAETGFQVKQGTPNPANASRPTSAVWYGKDVPPADTRLVALTLIRAGVEIRSILPLADVGGHEHLVEVGASADNDTRRPLSVDQVTGAPLPLPPL